MSDFSAITGKPVNSMDDLIDFFGDPDNFANSEYAQNILVPYAQSNWKLFVFFLVMIFFVIFLILMLLIWGYLFIRPLCICLYCIITKCICCCLCRKQNKEDNEALMGSPRSPSSGGGSPVSRTKYSPKASQTASDRINKIHKEQLKKTENNGKIVRPRRRCMCCINTCPSILLLVMLGVVGFIFWRSDQMDTSVITLLDDTNDFTKATSDWLCSDEAPNWQCNANSLGQFSKNAKGIFNDISYDVVDFIDTFSDNLETNLNNTADTLSDVLTEMTTITPNLVYIADNMTELGELYNDIPNTEEIDLPTIDTSMMDSYTGVVNTTLTTIETIKTEFSGMLDDTLGSVKDMFTPGAEDSVVDMANSYINQGIKYIYDAQNYTVYAEEVMSVILGEGTISDIEEVQVGNLGPIDSPYAEGRTSDMTVNQTLQYKTYLLCIIFIFPALVLLLTILFNYCCFKRGCRVQLFCNLCSNFIFIFIVFFITAWWSFLGLVAEITCEYHDDVIALIPEQNFTFEAMGDTISLSVSSQVVNDILTCTDENKNSAVQYSDTDNLISIFGLSDDLHLVNDTLQSYRSNITEMLNALPTDMIDDAEEKMKEINVTAIFSEVSSYIDLASEISSNLTDIKDSLPANESINSAYIRDQWNVSFFAYSVPVFWTNYTRGLDKVNELLDTSTTLEAGLKRTFTYESILTTNKEAFGTASCYCEDVPGKYTCTSTCTTTADYPDPEDYAVLYETIEALELLGEAFNTTVGIKNDLYANLTLMETYTSNIESSLIRVNDSLDTISNYLDDLGDEVTSFVGTIGSIGPGIDGIIDEIMNLVELVTSFPAYMKCYFIADFYENAFQGVICQEFTPSLIWGSWSMFLFMCVLMLSFIASSCCIRAPHIHEDIEDEDDSDEEYESDDESESGVQMTRTLSLKSNQARPVSIVV